LLKCTDREITTLRREALYPCQHLASLGTAWCFRIANALGELAISRLQDRQ
jgi:hypothetical protein